MSATLPTPPDATNKALGVNIQYLEQTIGNASIDVTTGPADAAKLVKTDANGVIDLSFLPQSSMVVHGVVDVTAPMTITPTWGDTYFVSTTGTPDGSWAGMGSSASTGDQITFGADNKWHVVQPEDLRYVSSGHLDGRADTWTQTRQHSIAQPP